MRISDWSSDVCSSDLRRPVRRARWPTLGSTGGAVAPRCRQPPARTEPSVQALCPCATMWLVKAPKPPLDEQIPQATIAPGDISAEQAEAMADAADLPRWKGIWAELAAKLQSAEPLTQKESSRRPGQAKVGERKRTPRKLKSLMPNSDTATR